MTPTRNISEVCRRWEKAPVKSATPEEVYELQNSSYFYGFNTYAWKGQPYPADGEVGYDDKSGFRITCQ